MGLNLKFILLLNWKWYLCTNSMKHRYFVHMAYNGSRYLGWQLQREEPTVQSVVNDALSRILRSPINVVGCGRTDTGVFSGEALTSGVSARDGLVGVEFSCCMVV